MLQLAGLNHKNRYYGSLLTIFQIRYAIFGFHSIVHNTESEEPSRKSRRKVLPPRDASSSTEKYGKNTF